SCPVEKRTGPTVTPRSTRLFSRSSNSRISPIRSYIQSSRSRSGRERGGEVVMGGGIVSGTRLLGGRGSAGPPGPFALKIPQLLGDFQGKDARMAVLDLVPLCRQTLSRRQNGAQPL